MKNSLITATLLVAFTFLSSCKKTNITLTPTETITGAWSVSGVIEKSTDNNGTVTSSTTIPVTQPSGITNLLASGKYYTYPSSSSGSWELSSDGKKIIYDRNGTDERYYKITELTLAKWVSVGPYRLDDKQYFSNKIYEYSAIK
jgi:hypothetical protein